MRIAQPEGAVTGADVTDSRELLGGVVTTHASMPELAPQANLQGAAGQPARRRRPTC
jgi:hypothetical protein